MTRHAMGAEAPAGSIAQVVFGPPPGARRTPARAAVAGHPEPPPGSIASIVLGGRMGGSRPVLLLGALALAVMGHALPVWAASRAFVEAPAAPPRRPVLAFEHLVELTPPPAPAAPPAPAPAPPPAVRVRTSAVASAPRAAPREHAVAPPPAPAMAGQVVAAQGPAEPLDLTGFDIVTGGGPRFVGGSTSSAGTSTQAVHSREVAADGVPDGTGGRARPVSLPASNWHCPWPREAGGLGLDEQVVVLQAVVRPDGTASAVQLLADPGHGFGEAALACARQARFAPAADEDGEAYTATSPPIHVRFTR
ncbi:energy transducer TonB [Archangium gephyra]|uniref:energy transducer TonB n=1 Tax=Archangium gephyra TaxID=48 RepID=UPI003B80A423